MTKLFEPIKIGQHTLQHRVVLAPLTRLRATIESVPTDLMVEYYRQRSSTGGLLIAEGNFISPTAGGFPQGSAIYSKEQIKGWKRITDAVHEQGGVIFSQNWHAGRAKSSKQNPNNEPIVSASAIAIAGKDFFGEEFETPRALEVHEIKALVQDFKQSALNAIEAGFDGVEVHGANGFLLDQFLHTSSNQRTDEYGGSVENRARFALEVVDAVVEAIGPQRTAIRFSPGVPFNDMYDENPVETWSYVTEALQKRHPHLAYIHFIEPRSNIIDDSENSFDSLKPYRNLWKGPFITAGGFSNTIKRAVDLAENTGDLIAFGRAFIANPDLPGRIQRQISLNKYDRNTFYTSDSVGYTDYPFYSEDAESKL